MMYPWVLCLGAHRLAYRIERGSHEGGQTAVRVEEVAVRKEAVYMISEQQRQAYLERKEAEEAAKPREHRPEDEWVTLC